MSICDDCAMRLFNTKHYNLQGIGNPYSGKCIVVPNVDYNAYKKGSMSFSSQVKVIKDIIISFTGEVDCYIIPLIRCNETISCELNDDIYCRCLTYFANDISKYDFEDILLLGDAGRRFLHCDIKDNLDNMLVSNHNRRYCINYSPFIKLIDADKFEVFKSHLIKWYNCVTNKYYETYNIIKV